MVTPQEHQPDGFLGRRLFSLTIDSPQALPESLDLYSKNFVCLLAWDAREASVDEISALTGTLLRLGASYFVCWGPDCERVHDIIDETTSLPGADFGIPDDSCIMTTWHDREPLQDALSFFLLHAVPSAHYQRSTNSSLAISIRSSMWGKEIIAALRSPNGFIAREP